MPGPAASVIVPAHNAQATLPRTLRALAEQDLDAAYEVIVVDDGSTDATPALARASPGVRVVGQPRSGQAAARNLGVARAAADALAFCDADVYPTPGWLRHGVEALTRAELVQGRVLPDPLASLGPFDRTIWITAQTGLWEAANLFVTRELYQRIGGFGPGIMPRAGKQLAEDVVFGHRALELGARPAFSASALAHHAVFERSWRPYVGERRRTRFFPAIARAVPELRDAFLYRRWFLDARSARFDLALAACAAALAGSSALPLLTAAPYLRVLYRHGRRGGEAAIPPVGVLGADAAADLVGFVSLLYGSARHRTLVL